jgi:parallel beta helix pectate lyase-like protein
MKRSQIYRFLMSPIVPLLIVSNAMGKNAQVGTCLPHLQTYSTISQAVAAVAPGSTILVCPGTYPEQVTITQPLTLRGVRSGNAANPTITVPPGGLTESVVAPTNGVGMSFQILVQGTESEQVTISNIAVDGTSTMNAELGGWIAGIYYQNSSGTIRNVATYGQNGNGYGFGIFLESTTTAAKTVTITHTNVHDFDADGIRSNALTQPPTLTVDIRSNLVVITPSSTLQVNGVSIDGVGVIADNLITAKPGLQGNRGIGIGSYSGMKIFHNTVAGAGISIWPVADSNQVISNRLSSADGGIVLSGKNNIVEHNSLLNISGAAISFNCTGTSNEVTHNTINESDWGVASDPGGNAIAPNKFSNVTLIVTSPC